MAARPCPTRRGLVAAWAGALRCAKCWRAGCIVVLRGTHASRRRVSAVAPLARGTSDAYGVSGRPLALGSSPPAFDQITSAGPLGQGSRRAVLGASLDKKRPTDSRAAPEPELGTTGSPEAGDGRSVAWAPLGEGTQSENRTRTELDFAPPADGRRGARRCEMAQQLAEAAAAAVFKVSTPARLFAATQTLKFEREDGAYVLVARAARGESWRCALDDVARCSRRENDSRVAEVSEPARANHDRSRSGLEYSSKRRRDVQDRARSTLRARKKNLDVWVPRRSRARAARAASGRSRPARTARRPSRKCLFDASRCNLLQEETTSSRTLQKSAATALVRPTPPSGDVSAKFAELETSATATPRRDRRTVPLDGPWTGRGSRVDIPQRCGTTQARRSRAGSVCYRA